MKHGVKQKPRPCLGWVRGDSMEIFTGIIIGILVLIMLGQNIMIKLNQDKIDLLEIRVKALEQER